MKYTIGIDLGGTNIAAAVVNENYELIGKGKRKTYAERGVEAILDDMAAAATEAVQNAGLAMTDIASVGIGCPGSVNPYTGVIATSNNLPFANLPMREELSRRLGNLPIYLDNDANAAAYGEMIAGAGKGTKDFIAVTLGTGVGGGVVVDGKMVVGANCAGGEVGHTVMIMNGEPCTCGRKGCFEAYASATALIRQTKAAMEAHPESKMWELTKGEINNTSGLTSFDGMRAGDPVATAVVEQYCEYVACGVTNLINIFQPEILCIGGGVSKEKEYLLGPVRKYVEHFRYSKNAPRQTEIKTAELGNDAGIIGAAFLYRLYENN